MRRKRETMRQAWRQRPAAAMPAAVAAFQFQLSGLGGNGRETAFERSPSVSICHWDPIGVESEGALQNMAVAREPLTISKRSGVVLGRQVHAAVYNSGEGS